jgi:hypothetical protein
MILKCQSKDLNKVMTTSVNLILYNIKKFKLMLEQQ